VLHGTAAIGSTGGVSAALIVAVAHVRGRGEVRRWLTVAGLLAAVFVVTLGCALAVPGGGAG
jgi:O-antigen/teichoic acid export membrane protein